MIGKSCFFFLGGGGGGFETEFQSISGRLSEREGEREKEERLNDGGETK